MSAQCLLVDDNTVFLTAMRHLLERGGVTVVGTASNSVDAVARARESRPDVVLVDVRLGADSGFDVAERIETSARSETEWQPTIVLLSSHTQDEFSERMAAHPSLGFLDKTTLSAEKVRSLISR